MIIKEAYQVYGAHIGICSEIDLQFGKQFVYKFGRFVKEENYMPTSMDGTIYVIEDYVPFPNFSPLSDKLFCVGDFDGIRKKYGETHSVTRYVIYSYILSVLERCKGILSCHASAVYNSDLNVLLLFVGTAGAGKTTLLLAAISRGWKIVGNDLVAAEINVEYAFFYTGPAHCPVKSHTLKSYVDFLQQNGVMFDLEKVKNGGWLATDNLDLTSLSIGSETVRNPRVFLILPKLESTASTSSLLKIEQYSKIREEIYEYATEKIRAESLMNYRFPVPSFDDQHIMYQRINRVESFIKVIEGVYFAFGNPEGVFQQIERILL